MLLHLWQPGFQTGNPQTIIPLSPGGAGSGQSTPTAPSEYYPYLGINTQEPIKIAFQDTPLNNVYNTTTATPQGTIVSMLPGTATTTNTGGANFSIPQQFASVLPKLTFGCVDRRSDVSADPGGEAWAIATGPALALCTTGANAITYGTLLTTDGNGNLTSYNNPSAAPTPTVTPVGTSGSTTYTYGLVAVSPNGTYSAIATATTGGGNATLSNTNYNQITWTPVADAVGYIVVRTVSSGTPSAVGVIGYVQSPTAVFNDTGLAVAPNTSATQFFQRLAAPSAGLSVVSGGTSGSTTWQYKVTAIGPNGVWSAESAATSATNGASALTTAAYTTFTWTNVAGAVLYAIDRTSAAGTPSSTGLIGFANSGVTGFRDIGYAATTFTAVTTPLVTPQPGTCLAISLGTLAANTSTAASVPVYMLGF